jgi:hypothetical protein
MGISAVIGLANIPLGMLPQAFLALVQIVAFGNWRR